MAIKKILQAPNELLNTKCTPIKELTPEINSLVKDLQDTLNSAKDPEGAGIAAPQIGILKRVCIVKRINKGETIKEYILINPEITSSSAKESLGLEGCLSIKNLYGKVLRPERVTVKFLDENFESRKLKASGYLARLIQHEIDHLDGILFDSKIIGKRYTEEDFN
jgi:peptide deformylase